MSEPTQTYDGKTFEELLYLVDAAMKRHAEIERVRSNDADARTGCRYYE